MKAGELGRRAWLQCAAAGTGLLGLQGADATASSLRPSVASGAGDDEPRAGRALQFPRDFGAHPGTRLEWWYVTGALQRAGTGDPRYGFQITFFRTQVQALRGSPDGSSRLRARHLVFAHAALTDVASGKLVHAERWSRWNGQTDPTAPAGARLDDTGVHLGRWHLRRHGPVQASVYEGAWEDESGGFGLQLTLQSPQPPVLQGDQGYSRKSPRPGHASGYYSQPQLRVGGQLRLQGQAQAVQGVGWLDHEWSQALLDPEAVGWDWMGLNLDDGGALTVFRLRRQDGSVLWAGGSWRTAQGAMRSFTPQEVLMRPERTWRSPATNGLYPVEWTVQTPAGRHRVQGLADAQELDNRNRTGTVYWEGISRVLDEQGRSVGVGYLEMTGYAGRLEL